LNRLNRGDGDVSPAKSPRTPEVNVRDLLVRFARGAALVGVVALCACKERTRVIDGDAFLMMQSGDAKKASGITVYLVDAGRVHAALARLCDPLAKDGSLALLREWLGDAKALKENPEIGSPRWKRFSQNSARAEAIGTRLTAAGDSAFMQSARDSARTGLDAHFRFSNATGRSVLFSRWGVGGSLYAWAAPVPAGDSVRVNLDANNVSLEIADAPAFFCGVK
jgi:hypothetical protein